ncbi:hypothetical protein GCK32_007425 [Trichostrongylus colubriformis]|uniref:Uncharacterized protein n=1 Tax=Trichostrongylus colubriformis TaxID=6319 RepID=A0AAN8FHW7_TRICO
MASREEDGDIELITAMTTTEPLDCQQVQMELEMAAISLQRQKKIASVLVNQWNHHKNEDAFILASVGERMWLTTHCLREAEVTKERILQMGTRYLLMDRLYQHMEKWGEASSFEKQDFFECAREYAFGTEAIRDLIITQRDVLDIEIKDMKTVLAHQERELKEGESITSTQVQRIVRKEIESLRPSEVDALKRNVEEHEAEIILRRRESDAKSTGEATEEQYSSEMDSESKEDCARETADENRQTDDPDDDECYWRRMVREVAEGTSDEEIPSRAEEPTLKSRKIESSPRPTLIQMEEVRERLARMRFDLSRFPFRDPRDPSFGISPSRVCAFYMAEGVHFSDACPFFRDGNARRRLINKRGVCVHCMENRQGHQCRYRSREFYCFRLSDIVFADLREEDGGIHHKAICRVPDEKEMAIARLEDAERELWRLKTMTSSK